MKSRVLVTASVLFLTCLWLGCGPDNPLNRKAVSGKVTFNGQPLERGNIMFYPTDKGPVVTGASITNGQYAIATAKGLTVGKYTVQISSPNPNPGPNDPQGPGIPLPELIPPEYNVQSDKTVTVTEDGPNVFDFDITKK